MHGHEKSDPAIMVKKPTNKAGQPASEPVERSAGAKGNAAQQSTRRSEDRESVTQALCTASRKAEVRGEVHFALPPSQYPNASDGVLRTQKRGGARRGRTDVAGQTWRSRICTPVSIGERIAHSRPDAGIYRKRTEGSAHSRSPPCGSIWASARPSTNWLPTPYRHRRDLFRRVIMRRNGFAGQTDPWGADPSAERLLSGRI